MFCIRRARSSNAIILWFLLKISAVQRTHRMSIENTALSDVRTYTHVRFPDPAAVVPSPVGPTTRDEVVSPIGFPSAWLFFLFSIVGPRYVYLIMATWIIVLNNIVSFVRIKYIRVHTRVRPSDFISLDNNAARSMTKETNRNGSSQCRHK